MDREQVIAELIKELGWDVRSYNTIINTEPKVRYLFNKLVDARLSSRWRAFPEQKPDRPGMYLVTEQWAGMKDVFIVFWDGDKWKKPYAATRVTAFQDRPSPFRKEGT